MVHVLAVLAQEAPSDPITNACGAADETTYICRKVFEWTDNELAAKAADWALARPLTIVLILAVAWLANRVVRRAIRRFEAHAKDAEFQRRVSELRRRTGVALLDTGPVVSVRRAQRAEAIGAVMRSATTALIYGVALLMAMGELGVNLGPLIAGAGIVGVALGFGAQSLVKDFLSGMFMLVEDQFGVGDIVDAGEAIGVVEGISLRATKLRDLDGTLWHIPNGEIRRIGNKSQQWARALLDVEVAYGTDIDRAAAVIKETADAMWRSDEFKSIVLEEPEIWGVETLGASGVAIRLVLKTRPGEQWDVARKLRWKLKASLDAAGIEIPFPQRTIWIRQEGPTGSGDGGAPAEPGDGGEPGHGGEPGDGGAPGDRAGSGPAS